MNLDAAIEFVRKNGNMFEQARLKNTLGEPFDTDEVLKGFSCIQNPDSGFPFGDRKGFPSCLSNTAMAMHNLMEMGLGNSEPARQGMEFLKNSMAENGTWEENPMVKPLDPPFWDMPGEELTTIWLTADIADILLRAGEDVAPETVEFLKSRQGEDGRFQGFYHTTWMALSVFGRNGIYDGKVFSGALKYLETADIEDWDASCIAWCLDCMRHGEVDADSILGERLLDLLARIQEPDGGWPSEGGDISRVRDTNSLLAAAMDIIDK